MTITKPSGRKHHLTYNLLGNITQIQFKNTAGTVIETQTMTYDAYGRETGVASSQYSASTAKSYNHLGQLATEATTYSGETYTVSYAYDTQGRLNEMTYPSGKEAEYTYDDRQQLETISWQGSQVEDRSYNDIGLLTGVDRAYVDETRTYTAAGRVNTINSNNVGSMTYSYDANGNVTGETLSGNMANYTFTTVSGGNSGYDGEDRFTRFIRSGVSEDIQLTRTDIGNISNVNLNGGNTTREYTNSHELESVGAAPQVHDSDGNTTTLHTNVTASWDDAGRAKHTNTPTGATAGIPGFNEYGYVGGMRVWKKITQGGSVVEHRVFIHAGPNLIAECNAGVSASTPVQEYVYADQIDSLMLIHRSDGTKYGVSRNRQWSVVALHDLANGNVVERYAYEMTGKRTIYAANGSTVRSTSSYGNNFGYTNRWHDAESGLMYFRSRYYNPLTGEFLSRDPREFVDGMSLYRGYFGVKGVDPFGFSTCSPDSEEDVCGPSISKAIVEHLNDFIKQDAGDVWFTVFIGAESQLVRRNGHGGKFGAEASNYKGTCGTGRCVGTRTLCDMCISRFHIDHILIMVYSAKSYGIKSARSIGQYNENFWTGFIEEGGQFWGSSDAVSNADLKFNELALCIAGKMKHRDVNGGITDLLTVEEICECTKALSKVDREDIAKKPASGGRTGYHDCKLCDDELPTPKEMELPPIQPVTY